MQSWDTRIQTSIDLVCVVHFQLNIVQAKDLFTRANSSHKQLIDLVESLEHTSSQKYGLNENKLEKVCEGKIIDLRIKPADEGGVLCKKKRAHLLLTFVETDSNLC